jgi:hypothetical protein
MNARKPALILTSVKFQDATLTQIDARASKERMTRGAMIRRLVDSGMEQTYTIPYHGLILINGQPHVLEARLSESGVLSLVFPKSDGEELLPFAIAALTAKKNKPAPRPVVSRDRSWPT